MTASRQQSAPLEQRVVTGSVDHTGHLLPVLGLDVGGTKLAVGVVTADGSTHGVLVEPTRREEGWQAVVARLFDMGRRAVAASGVEEIQAVGIACGGPLDPATGTLHGPPHLPGWFDVPLGALATEAFGVPCALQNDASAAALGEYRFGAGRGAGTMIYLTVSTGIGGGAVIGGRLHAGAAGNGGEFGHVTVRRGGRRCSCGRLGCIEAYASGSSIAARAQEALAEGAESSLALLTRPTAADVSAAAAGGDPLAASIWAETVDLLGGAVTDLVNVFEPDVVVLGGGVTRAGAQLLEPVRRVVDREAMPPARRAVSVELAGLGELTGVVGAGSVAHDMLTTQGTLEGRLSEQAHV